MPGVHSCSSSSHHIPHPYHRSQSLTNTQYNNMQPSRARRGRQARPSQLSSTMHRAVRRFARSVGAPNVVPPAGFRDFRGWIAKLSSRESNGVWDQLIASIARDVSCDIDAIHALKEDIVREIVKCVVIPRPEESAKLVSTNAGRQASRPRSGTTLMVVLEQQLARVECRLPQLVAETSSSSSYSGAEGMAEPSVSASNIMAPNAVYPHSPTSSWASQRQRSALPTPYKNTSSKLPSVADILGDRRSAGRASLPSFKVLDESIRRSRSSPSNGR